MASSLLINLRDVGLGIRCDVPYEEVEVREEACIENVEVLRYHTGALARVFCIFGSKAFKAILPAFVNDEYRADGKLGQGVFAVTTNILLIRIRRGFRNDGGRTACGVPICVLKIIPFKLGVLGQINIVCLRESGICFNKIGGIELDGGIVDWSVACGTLSRSDG